LGEERVKACQKALEDAGKFLEEPRAELFQVAHLRSLGMTRDRLIKLAQLPEGVETELNLWELWEILEEIDVGKIKVKNTAQLFLGVTRDSPTKCSSKQHRQDKTFMDKKLKDKTSK
jgi:hypothetical protein